LHASGAQLAMQSRYLNLDLQVAARTASTESWMAGTTAGPPGHPRVVQPLAVMRVPPIRVALVSGDVGGKI